MSAELASSFSDTLDFISEAEAQNPWWRSTADTGLPTIDKEERSDLYNLVKSFHSTKLVDDANEKTAVSRTITGPYGIGKTTLLQKFINVALASTDAQLTDRIGETNGDYELENALAKEQILYLPLEDSQYQLLPEESRIQKFVEVIEWYQQTQVTQGAHLIIVDDIDVLASDDPDAWKEPLLDVMYDNTYLIVSADSEKHAILEGDHEHFRLMPEKFADWVERTEEGETRAFVKTRHKGGGSDGEPLQAARKRLKDGTGDGFEQSLAAFDEIYFDKDIAELKPNLKEGVNTYLYHGGLPVTDSQHDGAQQGRTNLQLLVYKSLAEQHSLRNPENLFKLCAAAALPDDEPINYTALARSTGIDRRTLDDYFDYLEQAIVLSRSHDYSLQSHREGRLYLRDPHHMAIFSQRQLRGSDADWNREFESAVAQQVCFDHLKRLTHLSENYDSNVEYAETSSGLVDFVIRSDTEPLLVPISLAYQGVKTPAEAAAAVEAFDPTDAQPAHDEGEFQSPYRIVLTDIVPRDCQTAETLQVEKDGYTIYYVPLWLLLLAI
ncbi:ATP-binding protein [Natronorubrum sp. JWXQ-INN-674]|uniref:ATP-binding protein n=1 Tax=Natronorubrum halalkaliphilum TaxID=2691917 RepID=A0A6B0VMU8_9EURY|nr:ATP-binding protein [Natronorubrum halalkaliphilum]MXV61879.1 ATP-binding protein [Natronorubrum halalkaliphilum]